MERHANGRFRPDASEIASARRFVRSSLLSWGFGEQVPSLELAVSELVTNAMVHGEGEVEVQLTARGSHMRLEVLDQGRHAATPAQREIRPGERGGWGLRLVEQVSDSWGAVTGPTETRVWMERDAAGTGERDLDDWR